MSDKNKKQKQKINIRHGEIQTKLPSFHYFDVDSLVCTKIPNNKTTYEYYNTDTKKIDTITFPDYKKWYKENKGVWNSIDYEKAQFRLQYLQDENNARLYIRRRQDPTVMKPKLMLIIERMNKIYTKIGNRINDKTRTKPSTNTYSHFQFENEKYYWKDSTCSDQLNKFIFMEGRRIVLYRHNTMKIKQTILFLP